MPGFSFTAPIITPEEEQREREELGKEGLLALAQDLFGPLDEEYDVNQTVDKHSQHHHYHQQQQWTATTTSITTEHLKTPQSETSQAVSGGLFAATDGPASPQPHPPEAKRQNEATSGPTDTASNPSLPDRETPKALLLQLEESITSLSSLEKRDYLEAMQRVPSLVEKESNPHSMLQCEQNDVEAAAIRITKYWKVRRKLFGPNRAYRPMTQTGALMEDMEALHKGFAMILPTDLIGRTVVFFDRIRAVPPTATRDSVTRILFYVLQKATEDESTRRSGFIFIENLQGYDLYTHFDRILAKAEMSMLRECFPSYLKAFHISAGSGKWVVELILPVMKQIAGRYLRLRMVCHTGSTADLLHDLKRYHIVPDGLSIVLGGSIQYEDYLQWLDEESLIEQEEYADERNIDNQREVAEEERGRKNDQQEDPGIGGDPGTVLPHRDHPLPQQRGSVIGYMEDHPYLRAHTPPPPQHRQHLFHPSLERRPSREDRQIFPHHNRRQFSGPI